MAAPRSGASIVVRPTKCRPLETLKLKRSATDTLVVVTPGLIAIGYLHHGKLTIGEWFSLDVPAMVAGRGGDATAEGHAFGGAGGSAGEFGSGGQGEDARANGAGSFAMGGPGGHGGVGPGRAGGGAQGGPGVTSAGGEGGEAGQPDGRGGRGGGSGAEVMGAPNVPLPDGTHLWDYGRGGNGANTPEYSRRVHPAADQRP